MRLIRIRKSQIFQICYCGCNLAGITVTDVKNFNTLLLCGLQEIPGSWNFRGLRDGSPFVPGTNFKLSSILYAVSFIITVIQNSFIDIGNNGITIFASQLYVV